MGEVGKKPSNTGGPWSKQEDEQLKNEFEKQMTIKEISQIHSRTSGAIKSRLSKIIPSYSMNEEKVENNKPSNAGNPWSELEDNQLKVEFEAGMSIKEMSQIHNRTTGAIESRLGKQGIKYNENEEIRDQIVGNIEQVSKKVFYGYENSKVHIKTIGKRLSIEK